MDTAVGAATCPSGDQLWKGQMPPGDALRDLARCHAMAMPSEDEAFGVAYAEALACGVPAIGCAGEGGPEEIAALGEGMILVPPRDPEARGCQLSILAHENPKELHRKLEAAGVKADFREPNVIRAAPAPLYNSFHDVWRFAKILAEHQ